MKPSCVIFDLDGTIANIEHRLHMIEGYDPKLKIEFDWDRFNAACVDDKPYENIIALMRTLNMEHEIIICTGRMGNVRKETIGWLVQNKVPYEDIMMRPIDDYRSDIEIKSEMLVSIQLFFDVFLVFDDRDVVVKFWRSKGLTCLQVKTGDY